jgi:PAS domain S-box-containing protein
MQAELQETNRGVVALYAKLDDEADRLRRAEDRLRMLLDSVQGYAICMLGIDGEVASWNSGAARLFGYDGDQVVGRNYACFFTAADRDADIPSRHLRCALDDGRHESEGCRVRRGGSVFDAHVLLTPVRNGDGSQRGFALVIRDITDRKRLESDLRRRAEELEAANRAKEDFLATLSHELRTPLNAMLGWTRLLRAGKLDGCAMELALETIERNAQVQEQLITDILDLSRIVTGKLRLDLRPIEIAPIVRAAVEAVKPTADAKGVSLEVEVADAGTVMGDPDRLQQVIWNLLSNALKFTPSGGSVAVSSGLAGANVVVKVADTGEGITPDLLPFVFDRFRQGDASATRSHGGLGLGLSIVRHLVELHGGRVQAWSDGAGQGAAFAIQLPVRTVQQVDDFPRTADPPITAPRYPQR